VPFEVCSLRRPSPLPPELTVPIGVLIECDPSVKAIILKYDEERHDYIVEDLDDDRHLVIKESQLQNLKARLGRVYTSGSLDCVVSVLTICRSSMTRSCNQTSRNPNKQAYKRFDSLLSRSHSYRLAPQLSTCTQGMREDSKCYTRSPATVLQTVDDRTKTPYLSAITRCYVSPSMGQLTNGSPLAAGMVP
jgi:TFIIH basal transcription factor complex TTD-A subunit